MWRLPETNLCVSYLVVPGTEAKDTGDYPLAPLGLGELGVP